MWAYNGVTETGMNGSKFGISIATVKTVYWSAIFHFGRRLSGGNSAFMDNSIYNVFCVISVYLTLVLVVFFFIDISQSFFD